MSEKTSSGSFKQTDFAGLLKETEIGSNTKHMTGMNTFTKITGSWGNGAATAAGEARRM